MNFELSSPLKSGNITINIAVIHYKIFAAIKMLDSSLKLTTQVGKNYEHPKKIHWKQIQKNPNTIEELDRYKSKKIFSRHKIESALKLN